MELSFVQQSAAFLHAALLGVILGVFYGVLKFLRSAFSLGKAGVFICDLVFMLVCAMSLFFLSLGYIEGFVRIYTAAGALIGIVAYRITIGRLLCRLYTPVIGFSKRILRKICGILKIIIKKLLKFAHKILYNVFVRKERFVNRRDENATV